MILGHERQIAYLQKVFKNGRLAHAYLLHGPEHVGKLTVARRAAATFSCAEGKPFGCTSCGNCRLVEEDRSPFVIVLDTRRTLVSKKETRKDIPIEDIRELKRICSLGLPGKQWRVVIINEAEYMNTAAANALLKLLEEPGERTLFFFVTPALDLIPRTIVSRTQPIGFSLVSRNTLSSFLEEKIKDEKAREELLLYAGGKPGLLISFLNSKEAWEEEKKFGKAFSQAFYDLSAALRFTERAAENPEEFGKLIDYMLRSARLSLIRSGNRNIIPFVKEIQRISEIMQTTNVNPRLALDSLFIEAHNISSALARSPSNKIY